MAILELLILEACVESERNLTDRLNEEGGLIKSNKEHVVTKD